MISRIAIFIVGERNEKYANRKAMSKLLLIRYNAGWLWLLLVMWYDCLLNVVGFSVLEAKQYVDALKFDDK